MDTTSTTAEKTNEREVANGDTATVTISRDDLIEALVPASEQKWCGGPATTAIVYFADELQVLEERIQEWNTGDGEALHVVNVLYRLRRRMHATAELLSQLEAPQGSKGAA